VQNIKNIYHLVQAFLAAIICGFPAKKLKVIGVTGTDGKTTTVHMIAKILEDAGKKVAYVSTIGAKIGKSEYETGFHVTTPDPFALQRFLKRMAGNGIEYAVLEVTSHGLDQNRVAFIPFEIGVLTNITHEHLDYHKTFENYLKAKTRLFKDAKISVLNSEDLAFGKIEQLTKGKIYKYSKSNNWLNLKLKIEGDYNLSNALASAEVAKLLGIDTKSIKNSLENFAGLAGRMEEINEGQDFKVVVDFAHTPNALEQALKVLKSRRAKKSKLIAVFGCAGERDNQKRPMMGEISAKLADVTVITSEDTRSEDPQKISLEILEGLKKSGGKLNTNVFIETDRTKAIQLAIGMARKSDTVAIFGKGHEKSMNIEGIEVPWSDQETVRRVLKGVNK